MSANISPDCLEVFPEPLLVVSAGGRLAAANRSAADLLRLPRGGRPEITLREVADLTAAQLDDLLRTCLATTSPVPLRLTFFPAGARPIDLRCEGWRCQLAGDAASMLRIFDEPEITSRFSELSRLVDQLNQECKVRRHSESRLRSALAQLQDVNDIRDHMLAQVSHDLRTPLNAILGMSEFMRTEPFGALGEKYSEYVDDIHASGSMLLQLVDQVLHLAWVDAQGREATTEALVDLSECVENCCRVVEPIAKLRGLHILVPENVSLPKLRADRLLLNQILMNLLGNAAKYAATGGHIEISVEWRKGHALAIQVKDDGPGIPKDQLYAINGGRIVRDAYVTSESTTGFGLALSRRTAKAIGGRLKIRSVVGRGTVASLVLPSHLVEPGRAVGF